MTQVLGHLIHAGLVAFEHIAQDGMRVRASAGAASFHRQATLEKALEQARALVVALEVPSATATEPPTAREEAARQRAARERVERLEAALAEIPAAQAAKPDAEREKARVSSTDPIARVMKMADGGFRPAYNWEFALDYILISSPQEIVSYISSPQGPLFSFLCLAFLKIGTFVLAKAYHYDTSMRIVFKSNVATLSSSNCILQETFQGLTTGKKVSSAPRAPGARSLGDPWAKNRISLFSTQAGSGMFPVLSKD